MREIIATVSWLNIAALDAALRAALPGKVTGVSASIDPTGKVTRRNNDGTITLAEVRLGMDDSAVPADDTAALNAAAAHDPVFLSVDKTAITANGIDAATVTVSAPKQGAAAVTLSVSVNGAAPTDWGPITLVNGVGSDTLTALDPGVITVTVKNAANRSTDQLTIIAR